MKKLILGLILFSIGQYAFAQNTATPTNTFTPVFTWTFTNTATNTATFTATPTATFTPTFTSTATFTATNTASFTATNTATKTATNTVTNTATITNTYTISPTFTNTPTVTVTPVITNRPGPFTENTGYNGLIDQNNSAPFLSELIHGIPTSTPAPAGTNTPTPLPTATPISNSPSINYNCTAVTVLNKATPNAFATVVIPGGLTDNHQLCFSIAGISGGASIINTFGLQPVNGANAFIYGTGNFSNSTCAVANQKPCSVISYQISPNATPSGATTLIFNTCDWNN